MSNEDKEGALKAAPRYTAALDAWDKAHPRHKGILYRIGKELIMRMPKPPDGKKGWMNGSATAKFFVTHALENITATYEKYKKLFGRDPDYAVGHHPSYQVFTVLKEKLAHKGINLPLEWVVPDGNSSGATSLIAFVRSLSQYKTGDHVFYVSYGAGGSFTSFVLKIGNENQETKETKGPVVVYDASQEAA